jgi:hypothetical protein
MRPALVVLIQASMVKLDAPEDSGGGRVMAGAKLKACPVRPAA